MSKRIIVWWIKILSTMGVFSFIFALVLHYLFDREPAHLRGRAEEAERKLEDLQKKLHAAQKRAAKAGQAKPSQMQEVLAKLITVPGDKDVIDPAGGFGFGGMPSGLERGGILGGGFGGGFGGSGILPDREGTALTVELGDMLEFLRESHGLNYLLNKDAFRADPVSIEAIEHQPVKLPRMTNISIDSLLKIVLPQLFGRYIDRGDYVEVVPQEHILEQSKN